MSRGEERMKIACVQMDIAFANPMENIRIIEKYTVEAAKASADVIVFPEMWNTGYALEQLPKLADENGEQTKILFKRLAQKYKITIVGGSVATRKKGKFFNTMYVFNMEGKMIAEYDKTHLFQLMDEHKFLEKGTEDNIFDLGGVTCGGVICYDIRFPEWMRKHTLNGAKLMFVVAQWPKKRIDHWEILLQARAIENQCFIVAVNRVGSDPNNEYNGHSLVIAPWGERLLNGHTSEGIFYTDLDLEEVEKVRNTIPIFQDRRKDLY